MRTFVASPESRVGLVLSGSGKAVIAMHTAHYLPMVHRCMESIVPKLSLSENAEVAMELRSKAKACTEEEKEAVAEVVSVDFEEEDIDPSFFVPGIVPPISELGPEEMYLTINSAELCSALLFDDRR